MRYLYTTLVLLLCAVASHAATGDIIYQNCTSAGGCSGAGSNTGWVRTVETSGCHTGSCLKLVASLNSGTGLYGAGNTSITAGAISGHDEVTITYYVKYDERSDAISGGNIKMFIPYVGGSLRYGTVIMPHHGAEYYVSRVIGTFTPASWFDPATYVNYSVDNGDGTFTSSVGYTKGSFDDTAPAYPGSTWVKMTHYMKLPTTPTGTDGLMKVWVNNDLMIDFSTCKMAETGSETQFSSFTFYSSSEADEPFEHWMDEMVIYEGYVPPTEETCADYAYLCADSSECAASWPTYNWCPDDTPACTPSACEEPESTCADYPDLCTTEAECAASWPSYNWCVADSPSCKSGACTPPEGALYQGGNGTLSQGGTGTTTQ